MSKLFFELKNRKQVKLLTTRLGLTTDQAIDFLFEHENNRNILFKEFFKQYIQEWQPNGEDEEGHTIALWTFKFPKRTVQINQFGKRKDVSWQYLTL